MPDVDDSKGNTKKLLNKYGTDRGDTSEAKEPPQPMSKTPESSGGKESMPNANDSINKTEETPRKAGRTRQHHPNPPPTSKHKKKIERRQKYWRVELP